MKVPEKATVGASSYKTDQPVGCFSPGAALPSQRQIVAAALRHWEQTGFAESSLESIAHAAGLAPEAMAAHYSTKAAILEAAIATRAFGPELEALIEQARRAEVALDELLAILKRAARLLVIDRAPLFRLFAHDDGVPSYLARQLLLSTVIAADRIMRDTAGCLPGEHAGSSAVATHELVALLTGRRVIPTGDIRRRARQDQRAAEELVRVFFRQPDRPPVVPVPSDLRRRIRCERLP